MTETAALPQRTPITRGSGDLLVKVAFRNVGRNRRRTGLTAAGIGFAVFLITVSIALQDGSYDDQRENATGLLTGHVQIVHPNYPESADFADVVMRVEDRLTQMRALPGVRQASARVQAFALVSAGERSFAAQVVGLDFAAEAQIIRFFDTLQQGRLPRALDEGIIGGALARNLGAAVGDELVLLGTGKRGGIAAMALTVVGIYQTGITDIDRSLLLAPIEAVARDFGLADEAHLLIVKGDGPGAARQLAQTLAGDAVTQDLRVRPWQELLPEIEQAIELDRVSGDFMYGIVMLLVGFSVVNTFIMVMFERTREFGMLMALGLKPWSIIGMVQLEAFALWGLGTLLGWLLAAPLVIYFVQSGISLGDQIEQMAEQMYMPSRIYGSITARAILTAPLVLLLATQLAAFLPSLRLRKMRPVEAIRQET